MRASSNGPSDWMKRTALVAMGFLFAILGLVGIAEALYNGVTMGSQKGLDNDLYRSVLFNWIAVGLLLIPGIVLIWRGLKR